MQAQIRLLLQDHSNQSGAPDEMGLQRSFRDNYRIYSAIRRGFHLSRMTTNNLSVLCNFAIIQVLPFQNNPKDLDPSYKTDLDLWDCFGRKKNPSYIQGNTVALFLRNNIFCDPTLEPSR